MNGKVNNKKGSLIVEASITLPIFFIVVLTLILVISIISSCNSIVYNESIELRDISLDSLKYGKISNLNIITLKNNINDSRTSDFKIKEFRNDYFDGDLDHLISIESKAKFYILNPLDIDSRVEFDSCVVARAFVGKYEDEEPLPLSRFLSDEKSQEVVIFPRYGIRYHKSSCRYVTQYRYDKEYMESLEMYEAQLRGYTPCLVCGG